MLGAAKVTARPLHAARTTTASLLSSAGVPDKTISEILGHSQVQITQQAYIHTDTARHAEALRSLGALLAAPDAGG